VLVTPVLRSSNCASFYPPQKIAYYDLNVMIIFAAMPLTLRNNTLRHFGEQRRSQGKKYDRRKFYSVARCGRARDAAAFAAA
jgi:hypothetical protein